MQETLNFYAHGKLLLTAEYFVLDGAAALAVPTRAGQHFSVAPLWGDYSYDLEWTMSDPSTPEGRTLYLSREDWATTHHDDRDPVRARLRQLFYAAERLNPGCTHKLRSRKISTRLEFDPAWGLGSSSTLVHFLAEFLMVNPYDLLDLSFGGSGYDLACAAAAGPLLYRKCSAYPEVTPLEWAPAWLTQTYFVYRNQKQDSREGIAAYRAATGSPALVERASQLTQDLLAAPHLRAAARVAAAHEQLVAKALGITPVGEALFPEFSGTVKSLGAWGGDFVWALSDLPAEKVKGYFNGRGFGTVIPYEAMIL